MSIVIHRGASTKDHWITNTRLGGGFTIAEGAGTNGGEWALVQKGKILFKSNKKDVVQREYDNGWAPDATHDSNREAKIEKEYQELEKKWKKLYDERDALDDALADGLLRGSEKTTGERRLGQLDEELAKVYSQKAAIRRKLGMIGDAGWTIEWYLDAVKKGTMEINEANRQIELAGLKKHDAPAYLVRRGGKRDDVIIVTIPSRDARTIDVGSVKVHLHDAKEKMPVYPKGGKRSEIGSDGKQDWYAAEITYTDRWEESIGFKKGAGKRNTRLKLGAASEADYRAEVMRKAAVLEWDNVKIGTIVHTRDAARRVETYKGWEIYTDGRVFWAMRDEISQNEIETTLPALKKSLDEANRFWKLKDAAIKLYDKNGVSVVVHRDAAIRTTKIKLKAVAGGTYTWELKDEDGLLDMGNADTREQAIREATSMAKKLGRQVAAPTKDAGRLVHTEMNGEATVKVYWDASIEEYNCRLFVTSKENTNATYFTSDLEDAKNTAKDMARRAGDQVKKWRKTGDAKKTEAEYRAAAQVEFKEAGWLRAAGKHAEADRRRDEGERLLKLANHVKNGVQIV